MGGLFFLSLSIFVWLLIVQIRGRLRGYYLPLSKPNLRNEAIPLGC
jgi:hypothetical protein